MRLHAAVDSDGNASNRVRLHAYLNAAYETGFSTRWMTRSGRNAPTI